jgi:Histidine phosphatase superfamily (branch 1)
VPGTNHIATLVFTIVLCTFLSGCTGAEKDSNPQKATTVILIRHAERDNLFVITAEGRERAKALVDAVGDMEIAAIYSPDLERNLDTVKPLADHLRIDITLAPRFSESTIEKIVTAILTRHRGEVVLLVGNGSGNLRALHQRLGGTGDGPYQYGDMFLYTIPNHSPVEVKKSNYGSPTL